MKELQDINPNKDTASNAQIMFLVLNTSGLTVIPITIIADRTMLGSVNPTGIFIPTLIATFCSTLVGLLYVSYKQKINLFDKVIGAYIFGFTAFVAACVWYFTTLSQEELQRQSSLITSVTVVMIIASFLLLGLKKRLPLFETFIEGAKEGFETYIKIIPYLIAILVAVGVFKASGTLVYLTEGIRWTVQLTGLNADFVDALPVALMKPLSSQSARGMMITISDVKNFGPDSFVGNLASIFRGCADTTFYILAVYFGSINIRKTRYAVTGGLIADLAGVIAAIFVGYLFFH
jgi:spore maturation protein SpmB